MLTPWDLAKAFVKPFFYVIGGASLLLALAAASVGVNPADVVLPFLADAPATAAEPAQPLLVVWVAYGLIYLLLLIDFRAIASLSDSGKAALADVLTGISKSPLSRLVIVAASSSSVSQKCQTRKLVCGSGWSPGSHPQIE